jgi:hypothetical protein
MVAGNGEDTPAMSALRRGADVLEDGTDVSHLSDRDLVIRAVNSSMSADYISGRVLGELGLVRNDLREVRTDVDEIKRRLAPNGEIEHRARQASGHAFEEAVEGVAARIVEAVHDDRDGGRGNVSTERVLAMIREYDSGKEERARDERRKFRRDLTVAIVAAVIGAVATGAAGEMHGRATAPQVQTK